MLNNFAKSIKETLNSEKTFTENGAVGYKTSGAKLVDFNFKMSSYRNLSEDEIQNDFANVYEESPLLAVKMLFFAGDIRQGMGERRVFNVCMNWLANNHADIANKVIDFIPEYNRWDAVVNLVFIKGTSSKAIELISSTIKRDIEAMDNKKSVSLLAKWMPSVNASSKETISKAHALKNIFGWSDKKYRKTLSSLRKYLDVVEVKMTSNKWGEIVYENVPSKANILYKQAFFRHDLERRAKYLNDVEAGKSKINSSVAFPYDIVSNYDIWACEEDKTLEEMWNSLPDYIKDNGSDTICVVDGSGSMFSSVGGTKVHCSDVAQSLAIYFSEKMEGAFHNKFITFSRNPQLVEFKNGWSLKQKLKECHKHTECENTDIKKVFNLILSTAKNNNLKQKELPKKILILSDMEFDACSIHVDSFNYWGNKDGFDSSLKTLFETISEEYKEAGYEMPKLVFWNICSRTNTIPIKENKNGVSLISGFSPTIASMVFSEKLNPYDVLIEKLNSKRYEAIEKAIGDSF